LLHVAIYFNRFEVPNTDFFAFRRDALAYLRLDLPENFKRAPLYPLLMGAVSLLMPGPEPELLAGEVVNLLLTLLLVYLTFRIATALVGNAGWLVAFGVALSPVFMPSASQPLAEATLAVGIALTAYLAMRDSAWAYLAAAAASMTRYEAALLLPLLVLKDLWQRKQVVPTLLRAAAAGVPLALWFLLSLVHRQEVNPYVGEMARLKPAGLGNLVSCVAISLKFLLPVARRLQALLGVSLPQGLAVGGAMVVLAVVFLGLVGIGKKTNPIGWLLALFFAGYLFIHTFLWWAIEERYTYVVLWIVFLGIVAAARELSWRGPALQGRGLRIAVVVAVLLVAVAAAVVAARRLGYTIAIVYGLFAAAGLVGALLVRQRPLDVAAVVLGLLVVGAPLGGTVVTANDMAKMRHYRAPYRLAGEWLHAHVAEDTRVVSLLPLTLAYYAGLPERQVRGYFTFSASDCADFLAQLREERVDYVLWDSQAAAERRAYGSVLHRVDLMRCLFSDGGDAVAPGLALEAVISADHKRLRIFRVEHEVETSPPSSSTTVPR
jgi:hypothetical protein